MELVILIIVLAVIEYLVFSFQVGMAREKYNIKAPATSGHPVFERRFRVQQNTLEQLVAFIPVTLCFAWSAENIGWPGNYMAAGLGVFWLIGRFIYAASYVKDPATRGMGFLIAMAATSFMAAGTLVSLLIAFAG